METAEGGASFAELMDTVKGTIDNLVNKRTFLKEQQPLYEQIFDRIRDADTSEDSEEEWQYGEVVFQNGKFFQNIGYDYYLEKSREECLVFIKVRLNLIAEAISQFDEKLKEAHGTLLNMELLRDGAKSLGDTNVSNNDDDQEGFFEIREELDEDGNVIHASMTPANKVHSGKGNEVHSDEQQLSLSQERQNCLSPETAFNIQNDDRSSASGTSETGNKTGEIMEADKSTMQIAKENMYTFDDLVDQLDKLDNYEDGEIDVNDVEYDFDGYDEESDDNEEDEDYSVSIVPERVQHSFMEQIQALRANKKHDLVHTEYRNHSPEQEAKSILKKGGSKKKSVNFAPKLDVFEVENVKQETKSNTFNFPRNSYMESEIIASDGEDVEFDPDLFAQMIGAKEADVLHEKYQPGSINGLKESEEPALAAPRKKRISRFKKEKAATEKREFNTNDVEMFEKEPIVEAVVTDIVERDDTSSISVENTPIKTGSPNFIHKKMKSLQKPKSLPTKTPSIIPTEEMNKDDSGAEGEQNNSSIAEVMKEKQELVEPHFPAQKSNEIHVQPRIDFAQLDNLDDMARAYLLGLYDDDVEDPGTVLQDTSDFEAYNKMVETLKPELNQFLKENASYEYDIELPQSAESSQNNESTIINEIKERDPTGAGEQPVQDVEDQIIYAEVEREYMEHRRRNIERFAVASTSSSSNTEHTMELELNEELGKEPIDEFGNPVTTSRFKAQTLALKKHHLSQQHP